MTSRDADDNILELLFGSSFHELLFGFSFHELYVLMVVTLTVKKSTTPAFDESFDFKVDSGRLNTTTLTIQIKSAKKQAHIKGVASFRIILKKEKQI